MVSGWIQRFYDLLCEANCAGTLYAEEEPTALGDFCTLAWLSVPKLCSWCLSSVIKHNGDMDITLVMILGVFGLDATIEQASCGYVLHRPDPALGCISPTAAARSRNHC